MDKFESLTNEAVLDQAALLIDQSTDAQDYTLNARALEFLERLEERPAILDEHRILLHYFRANALENCLRQSGDVKSWSWDIEHSRCVLLSKDFYELDFQQVSEPDAEGLADLRNHLEHKYCQVHEDLGIGYSHFAILQSGTALGFRIGRDALEAKTLHILKLARAALIYLSLAVHSEEMMKCEKRGDKLIMSMPLTTWDERRRL